MLEIGKRYWLHGKFNQGALFVGTIEAIDKHFVKFVNCQDLRIQGNTIIVGIEHIEALWPAD